MRGAAHQRVRAHAKLNLSLRVLAREDTGFHQIETIFCALELADDIAIAITDAGITLDVEAPDDAPGTLPDLGAVEQNLAYRAARLFMQCTGSERGAHITLAKRIPAGAGLGGGSSDAAAVLTALNMLHAMPLSMPQLLELGARLGSDVPFFLSGAALALAWGRGGRMAPLQPLPGAAVLLVVPPERISTAGAYAALAAARADGYAPAPAIVATQLRAWADVAALAHNDFEPLVFALHPRLATLRRILEETGARIARLTGTGSVVFGVFDDDAAAANAAHRIAAEHPDVATVLTHTRAHGQPTGQR